VLLEEVVLELLVVAGLLDLLAELPLRVGGLSAEVGAVGSGVGALWASAIAAASSVWLIRVRPLMFSSLAFRWRSALLRSSVVMLPFGSGTMMGSLAVRWRFQRLSVVSPDLGVSFS
jgi:hypothetical protein